MTISKIGIITKRSAREPEILAEKLAAWLRDKKGLAVVMQTITPDLNLLVILGGDGTLLHVAGKASRLDIPLVGINLGDLGFLTEILVDELYEVMEEILASMVPMERRMLVKARLFSENSETEYHFALNEIAISKAHVDRMVHLSTWAGAEYIATYKADGLIFSTPTGSTAYNLSAGGPIVHPGFDCILVTPICPFMLGSRPIILPPEVVLYTTMTGPAGDVRVIVDGRYAWSMREGDRLEVQAAAKPLKLIGSPRKNYFEILRNKLNWGGGTGQSPHF